MQHKRGVAQLHPPIVQGAPRDGAMGKLAAAGVHGYPKCQIAEAITNKELFEEEPNTRAARARAQQTIVGARDRRTDTSRHLP